LTRKTANPVSSEWKVTRSIDPEIRSDLLNLPVRDTTQEL